jgi:UDP-GlcNAc3NAcA epimerase
VIKIVTVVGARPQFIKAAVVSRALQRRRTIREVLVHTGQHYDANMSDIFFQELGMSPPDHHLGIGGGGHGRQTGRMLEALESTLLTESPDAVLVYGDTNSTMAAALAAVKLHIQVAHVEAGLRSFNSDMPEEINRIVTDHVSSLLFTPTCEADRNLEREGVEASRIHRVGDVMYDAVRLLATSVEGPSAALPRAPYVLATIHRAETTDDPARLASTVAGLRRLARKYAVVLPLHPRTRAAVGQLGIPLAGIDVRGPLGYREMAILESGAAVIVTDSGGVQKEAFFHGVPCVTVRNETEWVELVDGGWNRLVSPDSADAIERAVEDAMSGFYPTRPLLYGDGTAGVQIANILATRLSSVA